MKNLNVFLIGVFAFAALEAVARPPATADAPITDHANWAKRAADDSANSGKWRSTNKRAKTLRSNSGLPTFWRPAVLRWVVPNAPKRVAPRATILI
jgi:hypothetical protein